MRWLMVLLFSFSFCSSVPPPLLAQHQLTEARVLVELGDPVPVFRGLDRHPAVSRAVVGSWQVSPSNFVHTRRGLRTRQGSENSPRWQFSTGERIALPLPGGTNLELSIDTRWIPLSGIDVYTGRINGRTEWLFTLAIHGNEILGRFFVENKAWILENFAEANSFLLHQLDRTKLPKAVIRHSDQHSGIRRILFEDDDVRSTPASCSTFTSNGANGHARVLFLHSSDVQNGIENLIASIVAEFNASASSSGVGLDNFISIAGIQQVSETFDDLCKNPVLERMKTQSGAFQDLADDMHTDKADLAFLLLDEDAGASIGDGCVSTLGRIGGLAWVLRSAGNPAYGLSTVTYALGDFTALHELGHVLGGLHEYVGDVDQAKAAAGVPDCARGWAGSTQDWMTIMGGYGNQTCPFEISQPDPTQQPCTRLPIWSNPMLTHNGEPAGDEDTADMALALEMTMPIAASWEVFPVAKPHSAPSAAAISQFCWGANNIVWGELTGADQYQLVGSSSPTFSGGEFLEYSGLDTQTEVLVPQSPTFYFRVRGCNGNGCGPWSNSVEANWFGGCL